MLEPKRILVPVDFSDRSLLALEWAVMIAKKKKGTTIYLLHTLPQDVGALPGPVNLDVLYEPNVMAQKLEMDFLRASEEIARKSLAAWRKKIPRPLSSKAILTRGHVAKEAAHICETEKINLAVITTHGRHGLPRLLEGSVSEEFSRLAPCPVLVLHFNKFTEKQAPHLKAKSR